LIIINVFGANKYRLTRGTGFQHVAQVPSNVSVRNLQLGPCLGYGQSGANVPRTAVQYHGISLLLRFQSVWVCWAVRSLFGRTVVSTEPGWTIGVRLPAELGIFLFSTAFRQTLGPTQLAFQWVSWIVSPVLKRPGHEPDHSPPSAAVKNAWRYTSTP